LAASALLPRAHCWGEAEPDGCGGVAFHDHRK
jgi:hypothetical protein